MAGLDMALNALRLPCEPVVSKGRQTGVGELSALSEERVPVACQLPSAASSFAFAQSPPSIFQSSQDPNGPHLIAALALGKKMGGCAAFLPPSLCRSHATPGELLFPVQMTWEWNDGTFSCSNV